MSAKVLASLLLFLGVYLIPHSSAYSAVNICAFSTDPKQYGPGCYTCQEEIYKHTLVACVNSTSMPKNVTFKQADCLQENCKVKFPEPTAAEAEAIAMPSMMEALRMMFFPGSPPYRFKRSLNDNAVDGSSSSEDQPQIRIVQHVQTVVGPGPLEILEPEYDE